MGGVSEWAAEVILLSPHFTVQEMIRSDVALRKGIYNFPSADVLENLGVLAQKLETVRVILGRPVYVSSGYRSEELNAAIGGSKTSAHMLGLAADFECPSFGTPRDVFDKLRDYKQDIGYDQLILEFPPDGWVHLGIRRGQVARGEALVFSGGRYERVA